MRTIIILLFVSFSSFSQKGENISVELPIDAYFGHDNPFKVSEINGQNLVIMVSEDGNGNTWYTQRTVFILDGIHLMKGRRKNVLKNEEGNEVSFTDETAILNFFAQFGWEFYDSLESSISSRWIWVLKRKSEQL